MALLNARRLPTLHARRSLKGEGWVSVEANVEKNARPPPADLASVEANVEKTASPTNNRATRALM